MSKLTHLSFEVLPDGRVEAHYKYDDGSLTSFDTAQLPEKVAPLVADLAAAQQARLTEIEPLAAQVSDRPITQAEIDAKDANIQALLARVAELEQALTETDSAPAEGVSAAEPGLDS